MQVEIWSDIACPWCYVGKRRFEAALAGFAHRDAVTVSWRSFELDPNAPRQHNIAQPELLARKYGLSVVDAQAMNARMTAAAAGEGLTFRLDDVQVGNTFDAHRLLHFADTHGKREVLGERLFAAYLGEGASLSDHATLVVLATEVGLPADDVRAMLDRNDFADHVRQDEREAQEIGVTGVPYFVLDRQYGVSGAQSPEVLRGALQQAWDARLPTDAR
jgi:predicted DsbA family dithiol-disulfide isomerase